MSAAPLSQSYWFRFGGIARLYGRSGLEKLAAARGLWLFVVTHVNVNKP